jgi:hypothetical protein
MIKRYLIVHGEMGNGRDPKHTELGLKKIRAIQLPKEIAIVVTGTGRRMLEILEIVKARLPSPIQITYSPFCGSGDILKKNQIILSGGRIINLMDYDGLYSSPDNLALFNAWNWVKQYPNNTLFLAGRELMTALGLAKISEEGCLYELSAPKKAAKKIG